MKRSSATLKALARGSLNGKYGTLISAYLLILVFSGVSNVIVTFLLDTQNTLSLVTSQIVLYMISLLVSVILAGFRLMLLNIAREKQFSVSNLFFAFSHHPDRFLVVSLVLLLGQIVASLPFTFISYSARNSGTMSTEVLILSLVGTLAGSLATLLLSLFFGLAVYLLLDNIDMGAGEALKESLALMKGNKGRLFYINLSFLPLTFACLFTCYLGFLWLLPYMEMTSVYFYMDVTGELDRPIEEVETPGNFY